MKTLRKTIVFAFLGGIFAIVACKKDIKPFEGDKKNDSTTIEFSQDKMESIFMSQSNIELMLADRIISKNDTYILDLSKEEAEQLHIPAELYNKYVEIVKNMNNSTENVVDDVDKHIPL